MENLLYGKIAEMECKSTIFFYDDIITHSEVEKISCLFSKTMSRLNPEPKLFNSVFSVFIELVQNISRYSDGTKNINGKNLPYGSIKVMQNSETSYSLETCNIILANSAARLENYLAKVHSMNYQQIKELHREKLINQKNGITKNAGLGILQMALESHNSFSYDFTDNDGSTCFFKIKINIGV